jgi:cytochrome c peroxidase
MFSSSYFFPIAIVATALALNLANAATPSDVLAGYGAQAGGTPNADRGRQLFIGNHGQQWTCASCHGMAPVKQGEHIATGKPIAPLAPGFNPERFTDVAKTEKWFRRNCKDVVGRECTSAEKADVLAWLMTLKP